MAGDGPQVDTFFSESFAEARSKFLAAAKLVAGVELHALTIVPQTECTTDIAIVTGEGPGLLVISSGTHGVEGYAGSAIQIAALQRLQKSHAGPTVVLVHAVNPFGMTNFRRVNENNVDLNRNCLLPHQFQRLVKEDQLQQTYMNFDTLFNPKGAPGLFDRKVLSWGRMGASFAQHGALAIKTALVAATYSQSQGLFFGGQELQPSHVHLREFMSKRFSEVRADSVAWIDVHTGLGPCGVDVLIGLGQDEEEMHALFPKIAGEFDGFQGGLASSFDETIARRCSPKQESGGTDSESQSAGYEFTVGSMSSEWVQQFFKPNTGRPLCFAQEFGTVDMIKVIRALIFENAGYHHDRQQHDRWRQFTRDAFYVRTADWKSRLLKRGLDVFEKMVVRAEAPTESQLRSRL